jgi:hypothetical protein
MRATFVLLLFFFNCSQLKACLEAFQFKIFPIGYNENYLHTFDVQVKRTSEDLANRDFNSGIENPSSLSPVFVLTCFLSVYDKNQQLISTQPYHTAVIVDSVYTDTLSKIYDIAKQSLYVKYPKMRNFKHCSYSFCDFNQVCKKVGLTTQTDGIRDAIMYKNKKYSLKVLEDENYFKLIGDTRYQMGVLGIGTINAYKTRGLKLMVIHLVSADQIAYKVLFPEAITENPTKFNSFIKAKCPIYEEPLLDHAYGVDFFYQKK